jgi:hypothetical protein
MVVLTSANITSDTNRCLRYHGDIFRVIILRLFGDSVSAVSGYPMFLKILQELIRVSCSIRRFNS